MKIKGSTKRPKVFTDNWDSLYNRFEKDFIENNKRLPKINSLPETPEPENEGFVLKRENSLVFNQVAELEHHFQNNLTGETELPISQGINQAMMRSLNRNHSTTLEISQDIEQRARLNGVEQTFDHELFEEPDLYGLPPFLHPKQGLAYLRAQEKYLLVDWLKKEWECFRPPIHKWYELRGREFTQELQKAGRMYFVKDQERELRSLIFDLKRQMDQKVIFEIQ